MPAELDAALRAGPRHEFADAPLHGATGDAEAGTGRLVGESREDEGEPPGVELVYGVRAFLDEAARSARAWTTIPGSVSASRCRIAR